MSTARATPSSSLSAPTVAAITLPGAHANTAPTITVGTQFNGIGNTTALAGQAFDYFSPFAALVAGGAGIFNDQQQAPNTLTYSAVLTDGSPLSNANLAFNFDPTTGAGEFKSISVGPDGALRDRRRRAADPRHPGSDRRPGHRDGHRRTFGHQHLRHRRGAAEQPADRGRRQLHHVRERRADHAGLDRRAAQRQRPERRSVHRRGGDRADQRQR